MIKYGIVLDGKLVRLCRSLDKLLVSEVYKPWYAGCKVFKFEYDARENPIKAEEMK